MDDDEGAREAMKHATRKYKNSKHITGGKASLCVVFSNKAHSKRKGFFRQETTRNNFNKKEQATNYKHFYILVSV